MGFDLSSLPQAVVEYLQRSVIIEISDINQTSELIFSFQVSVSNASVANGGIALTNVRYQVGTDLSENLRTRFIVPDGGKSIDAHGQPIQAGQRIEFLTFYPADQAIAYLHPGASHTITFTGVVQVGLGSFQIDASILADPDINALFPRSYKSSVRTRDYQVS